ncbi:hypothetical protein DBY21_09180 [Candidatus Gastranaerophilales bacterium]|nr:MAG: hypothetical protein DBY21_09180 [Candidatus Gastranaerophilales bacterium]
MTEKLMPMSKIESAFHKIYFNDITPKMEKYEKQRQAAWLKIYLIEAVLIIVFIICLTFFVKSISTGEDIILLLLFVNLVILALIFGTPLAESDNFAKKLKQNCMKDFIKSFGNISWYSYYDRQHSLKKKVINPDKKLRESELFGIYNSRSDDDTFEGVFKDVKYTISETLLQNITGSGRHKKEKTVFKGVIINFAANKTIKNKTIIATKNDTNIKNRSCTYVSIIGAFLLVGAGILTKNLEVCIYGLISLIIGIISIIAEKTNITKNKEILNEIKLEDPEFNKKYKAYSSDEVEGRYLITTAFMERFKNLQTAFGAKNVKCSFYGDDIMFAISTRKNLFEIGNLFTPLNSPKQLEKAFEELSSILALIDYFKLDEKTGL